MDASSNREAQAMMDKQRSKGGFYSSDPNEKKNIKIYVPWHSVKYIRIVEPD